MSHQKLASMVCSKLRKKFGLETSDLENDRMLAFLKLGRKLRVKKPLPSNMSGMDALETLPFIPEDRHYQETVAPCSESFHNRLQS